MQQRRLLGNAAAFDTFIFGLPNSIDAATDADGWTVIPFGLWPHTAGYQRFGAEQAATIVNAFKSGWGKFKRAICGAPVFKGHPDNPEMANQYPDKTEYGQIADMEVRPEGLAIKQVLSAKGASLVANGLDRISPNWYVRDTGEKKNERPIYEPVAIKSVGLVKKPNIPNLSLVNSKPEDSTMKELLIKLLALANEATDEQIVAAVTELSKRPKADELANAKNETATLNAKVADLTTKYDSEKARADASAVELANGRKTQVESLVNSAVKDGRIAAAEKATWTTILTNDFNNGAKILANVKPALKTRPRATTETLADADAHAREEFANGDDSSDGQDGGANLDGMANRSSKIQKLVNEEMNQLKQGGCALTGNSLRNRAWGNVKKHMPSLFTDGGSAHDDHETGADGDKPTAHKTGPTTKHKDTTQA